jgi:hypothetical protein
MAMNKQRRTSNINNIVSYDASGNVTLPAQLSIPGQLKLTGYLNTSSFTGTAVGYLAFDASGNILSASVPTVLNGTGIVRTVGTNISYISGTSAQFLKGDGSLDSSIYSLSSHTHDDRYFTETETNDQIVPGLRAGFNLTGGGTLSVDGSGNINWTQRLIVICNGRSATSSVSGFFDINIPTAGAVITGVGGAGNKTVVAAGIPLAAWEALYYILPFGSSSASVAANFRVVGYTADVTVPYNWLLLCVRNGDTPPLFKFTNGLTLGLSDSSAGYETNANVGNTLVSRDASGNFSAGTITAALSGNASTATSATSATNATNASFAATQAVGDYSTAIANTTFVKNLFGATNTSGTLDWNDVSNTQPGSSATLLLGNATNGFGVAGIYYHPFNLEYSTKNGTGNVTQLAIAYGLPGNDIKMRGRYQGSWTSWITFLNSGNYNSYSPTLTGGGASGTWSINVTGTAASETLATVTARGNIASGSIQANNFYDAIGSYNVNLGCASNEGRGVVAGYSGSSYSGIGYNVRHTTTGGVYVAPGTDTSSYLLLANGGFTFYGAPLGTAGRTLNYSTLGSFDAAGTFNAVNVTVNGNQTLHFANWNSYAPSLTGTGASGTWGISITGNAASSTNALRIVFNDGPRDLSDRLPTTLARSVNFDFVTAGTVGGSGSYAGVMSFTPWTGTTASTGDSSYQLAFLNETSLNGDGLPGLRIRKGIDTTWGSWYSLLHAGNYNSYAPTFTGTGASGTWGISITGNAATALSLTSSNFITKGGSSGNYNTDFTNTNAGTYRYLGDDSSISNSPGGTWWFVENFRHYNASAAWGTQVAWGWEDNANRLATRNIQNGTFGNWVYYLNSSNYNTYAPSLTGLGASGTWGINITGNAASTSTVTVGAGNNTADWFPIVWHSGNYLYSSSGLAQIYPASGYARFSYINTTDDDAATITRFVVKNGDNYHRSATTTVAADAIRGAASGTWSINVTGSAGSVAWANVTSKPNEIFNYDGWLDAPGYNANTIAGNKSGFTYANNAPYTGPIAHFAASNYGLQFNATYSGNGVLLAYRTKNGDTASWNSWHRLLNSAQDPYAENMNQYVRTSDSPTFNQVYVNGWFRNNTVNVGLYSEATTQHWSSSINGYWDASSTTTVSAIRFFTGSHMGTLRGYVYADNANNIGFLNSGGNWSLRCDNSGNVIATGDVTAYSDSRVKENVETLIDAVGIVSKLRGVTYNRTDVEDKSRKVGVIAQEVLEVLPEVVNQGDDGMYGVSYGNIVAVLIEAVKEQQAHIQDLSKQIQFLANNQ